MTSVSSPDRSAVNGIRTALGVGGVVALIVGLLILIWPGKSAVVVTAMIAVYAIIGGLIYAALGLFSKSLSTWGRIGHVVLGVLFIIAGIIAFSNLTVSTVLVATFVAVFLGITWIVEGVVALTTLGGSNSRGWTIFFAIVSIIAGILLVVSPAYIAIIWLFIGISLIVLGILQIIRAITFAKAA